MSDEIIEPKKTNTYQSVREQLEPLGDMVVQTPHGAVMCREVAGFTTLFFMREGQPATMMLMVFDPPVVPGGTGQAMGIQISASTARSLGASLIELANNIDGERRLQ